MGRVFCLPVFGFANAGVYLGDLSVEALVAPIPIGIALGLFLGKQIGVFGFAWLVVKLGLAKLPDGSNWMMMYGVCLLAGIGFTMSLFIGGLAFDDVEHVGAVKLGVLLGSILSGGARLRHPALRHITARRTRRWPRLSPSEGKSGRPI